MKITKINGASPRKLRVAAYCRVSTDKEDQQGSFSIQQAYYQQLIQKNPSWEMAGVYGDEGRSGTRLHHREQFLLLMEAARKKQVDLILVKSISRFSRNAADCQTWVRTLRNLGVEVRFEQENISSMDAASDFIFSILAVIAQEESRSISENVRWRYIRSFREGIYRMGSHRMLGYDMDASGRLVPNGDAWIIQQVFSDYLEGLNYSQIAARVTQAEGKRLRSFKSFQSDTICRILRNVTYAGHLHLQKTAPFDYLTRKPMAHKEYTTYYVTNSHPGIVDPTTWRLAQEKLAARKRQREQGIFPIPSRSHILYGLVFCEECKSPMIRKTYRDKKKRAYKSWCCQNHLKNRASCGNPRIREEQLLARISEALGHRPISDPSLFQDASGKRLKRILVGPSRIRIEYATACCAADSHSSGS